MNNLIKLLLFNILLCAAPAVHAMSPLRNFGVQNLKAAATTGFGIGLAGFVYKDSLNGEIQKRQFQGSHCRECIKNVEADYKKTIESLEKTFGRAPHTEGEDFEFEEKQYTHDQAYKYATILEKIKKRMSIHEDIPLYHLKNYKNACVHSNGVGCKKHTPDGYGISADFDFLQQFPESSINFTLAHELMHIKQEHDKKRKRYYESFCNGNEILRRRCIKDASKTFRDTWFGLGYNIDEISTAYDKCNKIASDREISMMASPEEKAIGTLWKSVFQAYTKAAAAAVAEKKEPAEKYIK